MRSDDSRGGFDQLWRSALRGSQAACETVLSLAQRVAFGKFRAAGVPSADLDDLVQATVLSTLRCLRSGKVLEVRSLRGFLGFRSLDVLTRYFKSRKRHGAVAHALESIESDVLGPDSVAMDREFAAALRECVEALPGRLRLVAELHYMRHMSVREVADATSRTPGGVRFCLREIWDRLSRALRERGLDEEGER